MREIADALIEFHGLAGPGPLPAVVMPIGNTAKDEKELGRQHALRIRECASDT